MIIDSLALDLVQFERGTGWAINPEGACRGDVCVLLPRDGELDVAVVAERLRMPVVHDAAAGLWAVGPASGGRVLDSAQLPSIVLPDRNGELFQLDSLRGRKVLLLAWASW